jgi:hypothetical protein
MLYRKTGSRYKEATEGQVIAECVAVLHAIGQGTVANRFLSSLMDSIGYMPPSQVQIGMHLPSKLELPDIPSGEEEDEHG